MSLQTDTIFIEALSASEAVAAYVGDRIYSTAIPKPEEDAENEPVPYIIVTFDGLQNDAMTKDNEFEGEEDKVQIGVTVVAGNRKELAELTDLVRSVIMNYFMSGSSENDDEIPIEYTFTAQAVQYDDWKPCYWQILSYACTTNV